MTKKKERPVIVTTVHRGVFFGYAINTDGKTHATECRNTAEILGHVLNFEHRKLGE